MNPNNGNQEGFPIRVQLNQIIDAPVQDVFPLACPVMEYKWIPGWKCELVHCPNGHAELGVVFREIFSAPILAASVAEKTTWTAVLYEPDNHRVHYRLDNSISSSLYRIEFEAGCSGGTRARLDLTYTPINDRGVAAMAQGGEAKLRLMLSILALMLKHYCENGDMVDSSEILKLAAQAKELTASDRFRSLLNKMLRMVIHDENRNRFEKGLPISKVKPTKRSSAG